MTLQIETLGPAPGDPRARQELVPMRDGVRLATDVYLPEGPGPFPAVLVRLPYDTRCSSARSSTCRGRGALAEVYLGHTGYRVEPGHRLRLHVAASDFPVFLPHPGTVENPWDATAVQPARQTLAAGGATPSYVGLTVLPATV